MGFGTSAVRYLATSPMRSAAMGAGVGAAARGLQDPGEGGSRLRNMGRGALQGAAIGGGVGALGRGAIDTRLLHANLNPGAAPLSALGTATGTARRMGQGVANFGKRQWHGVTGKLDHDAIGMAGKSTSARKEQLLKLRMADELKHAPASAHQKIRESGAAAIKSELEEGAKAEGYRAAGITTLPGIAGALTTKGRRADALRAMGRSALGGGVAMSVGVPAVAMAPSLMRGDESATGGQTMGQKVRGFGYNMASGAAMGGLPIMSQMALGTGLDAGIHALGRRRARQPNQPAVHGSMPSTNDEAAQ